MHAPADSDPPDQIPAGLEPRWECRFPGRLQYEMNALRHAGVDPDVDQEALSNGRLVLTFDWPLDPSTTLKLQVVFPDSYPHFRPQVYLLDGLDPLPARHRDPIGGNLCLLGRDSRQWLPSWTLVKLLQEQLENAIRETGEEDPQAEPAEYWWNSSRSGSFCLVDSSWNLEAYDRGFLLIRYVPMPRTSHASSEVPGLLAYVAEVRDSNNRILEQFKGPLPPELRSGTKYFETPWVKLSETIFPDPEIGNQMNGIRESNPWLKRSRPHGYGPGMHFDVFAIVYPSELSFGEYGLGWAMFLVFGHPQSFKDNPKSKKKRSRTVTTLPVYRAGPTDVGYRVPAVQILRDKRVLVVGTGAIGAPMVFELTRNGCGSLHLIENDLVEPGNTVRWPLGTSAWGRHKIDALKDAVVRDWPETEVVPHKHQIGVAEPVADVNGDDDVLAGPLDEVDLVIDASASHGVTTLLADRCRDAGVPLISVFATPTLEGGAVVHHGPGGGCPNCLLHAWHNDEIAPPPGQGSEEGLAQPPGCAERTFIGAGYDLQELSLQGVRLAVQTLSGQAPGRSVIQTLSFVNGAGNRGLPQWRMDNLAPHPNCRCSQ